MALAYQEHYTFDDYQLWKGEWELIEGMPYAMSPSPTVTHQTVSFNIASAIKEGMASDQNYCRDCCVLIETDWQISNDTIVRPDVMIVCQELDEKVIVTPELIIEVVSVSSTRRDEFIKFDLYQREGVMYYILVYPDRQLIKIYYNEAGGFKKVQDYISGAVDLRIGKCIFSIKVDSIWR